MYGAKIEGDSFAKGYSEEMREEALTFYIPVYENMEETPPERPTGDGSPNMKLTSLSVSGYELTPAFDDDTLEYSLVVPAHIHTMNIDAVAMDSKAKIAGAGAVELTEIVNTIEIVVTAENGNVRTYVITIAKEDAGISGAVEFAQKYTPAGLNILVAPNLICTDFVAGAMVSGSVSVTKSDGTAKEENEKVMTGDLIHVFDDTGAEYGVFTAVVIGDTNGDSAVTINDIIKVRNYMLGSTSLTGTALAAADANRDGAVAINDIIVLRNHILGRKVIS